MKAPKNDVYQEIENKLNIEEEPAKNSISLIKRMSKDDGYESSDAVQQSFENLTISDVSDEENELNCLSKEVEGTALHGSPSEPEGVSKSDLTHDDNEVLVALPKDGTVEINVRAPMRHEHSDRLRNQNNPFSYGSHSTLQNRHQRQEQVHRNINEEFQVWKNIKSPSTHQLNTVNTSVLGNNCMYNNVNNTLIDDSKVDKVEWNEQLNNILVNANKHRLPVLDCNLNIKSTLETNAHSTNVCDGENVVRVQKSQPNIVPDRCYISQNRQTDVEYMNNNIVQQEITLNKTSCGGTIKILSATSLINNPIDNNDKHMTNYVTNGLMSPQLENLSSVNSDSFSIYRLTSSPCSSTSENSLACSDHLGYNDAETVLTPQFSNQNLHDFNEESVTSLSENESVAHKYSDEVREIVDRNRCRKMKYWVKINLKKIDDFLKINKQGLNYIQKVAQSNDATIETHIYSAVEFVNKFGNKIQLKAIFERAPRVLDTLVKINKPVLAGYVEEIMRQRGLDV